MYIGGQYFDLKNKSKNQRRELRELKRLYEEAVAMGTTPSDVYGDYTRDDPRKRVTKQQLEKLSRSNYKDIYKSLRTIRDKLGDRGLTEERDYDLPKYHSPLADNPNFQIEAGGRVHDLENGVYYESLHDYELQQQVKEQKALEKQLNDIMFKERQGQNVTFPPPQPETKEDTVSADVVTVDNFLATIKPSYVSRQTQGTTTANELYEAIRNMLGDYGYEDTAKMIRSIPNDLMYKIQNGNSSDRYNAIEQCLEYVYSYFFDTGYLATAEEWNE